MQINTSEITLQGVKKLNSSSAAYVEMDDIKVLTFSKQNDLNKTLLYTEGVGPCITIIMCGEVQKNVGAAFEVQTFVATYHWSGGTKKQLDALNDLPAQLRGLVLAEYCYADMIHHIKTELCDVMVENLKNYKLIIDDIAIVGGERRQEQLSGSETQVRGLCEFLRSSARKRAFKEKYGAHLPEIVSTNVHVFRTADEKYMDVYISLDARGSIQVNYHIQAPVLLNASRKNSHVNYDSDDSESNDDTNRSTRRTGPTKRVR